MNKIKKIAPVLIVFAVMALVIFAQDSLIVDSSGFVGILTTSAPQSELEVNGRIRDKTGFVMPEGTIIAYGGTTAPAGWLLCDGSAISRSTYEDLFAAINTNYGSGNGSTTFNVPDLRGRFLRGVDGTANKDPDAVSRTVNNSGGNTGDAVGSEQGDAFQGHRHATVLGSHSHGVTYNGGLGSALDVPPLQNAPQQYPDTATWHTDSTDLGTITSEDPVNGATTYGPRRLSSETRPKNVNVNYIIKY